MLKGNTYLEIAPVPHKGYLVNLHVGKRFQAKNIPECDVEPLIVQYLRKQIAGYTFSRIISFRRYPNSQLSKRETQATALIARFATPDHIPIHGLCTMILAFEDHLISLLPSPRSPRYQYYSQFVIDLINFAHECLNEIETTRSSGISPDPEGTN